jgi:NADP-dependent 3-hydroxy acid dehydrogenase YdfG
MTQGIENKVIVITGASSGLGEAAARRLARDGAKLVLGARRVDRLQTLAQELSLGNKAFVKTDVADRAQVKRLVDRGAEMHGLVDVIINNAGLMPSSRLELLKVAIITAPIRVQQRGQEMRLVFDADDEMPTGHNGLVRLLARAHTIRRRLAMPSGRRIIF